MVHFKKFTNKVVSRLGSLSGRTTLSSMPPSVDIVITKSCNLACTFCKDYETVGAQRLSLRNFERAARQLLPTASVLQISSGGEPYLHTDLEEMLRIAKRYGVETRVLSNGMLLKEKRVRTIVEEGLIDMHGFSVDGIKPETVETIRTNADLKTILANIDMVFRLRQELKKKIPRIFIRYALMRSNIEELPEAVRYWGKRGAARLNCDYVSLANDLDPNQSLFYHQDLYVRVRNEALKAARDFPGFRLIMPPATAEEQRFRSRPKPCAYPWHFVMIDTNGEIMPCYYGWEALRFPSIYKENGDFNAIWNSEPYQKLRSSVNDDRAGKFFDYCKICPARTGWADEKSHLGDYAWAETVGLKAIDHRRPVRGLAARKAASEVNHICCSTAVALPEGGAGGEWLVKTQPSYVELAFSTPL